MGTLNAKTGNAKYIFHIVVFLFFLFGFGYIPSSIFSVTGMKVLGIFIGMIYGWSFLGFVWPSILMVIALGFTECYTSPLKVFNEGFGTTVVILLILIMPYIKFCEETGLSKKLAYWFLSRRSIVGHPWRFLLIVLLGSFITSWLIHGTAMLFILWTILYGISVDAGFKKGDSYPAALCFAVVVGSLLSYGCKPWSTVGILAIGSLESVSGGQYIMPYFQFIMATGPYCIMVMLGYFLVVKFIFRPDVAPFLNLDESYIEQMRKETKLDFRQKYALCSLLVYVLILTVTAFLPASNVFVALLKKFDYVVAMGAIVAVACLVRYEGKPLMDFTKCSKGISWEAVWMIIAATTIGNALCSDASGIMTFLDTWITATFSDAGVWVFIVVFTSLLYLMTQISHNVTVVVIGVPIVYSVCMSHGLNPLAFTTLVNLAAATALATPAASTIAGLGFANVEWIGFKYALKSGIAAMIVGWICLFIIALPLSAIFFGFTL